MSVAKLEFSADQAEAWDRVAEVLQGAGIDLANARLAPAAPGDAGVLAVVGKAGSGKTMLLAALARALAEAGVETVSGDYEGRRRKDRRTLAILAPTNKAASVLRGRGVPATTIHRILYTPVYDPEYERIAEWLTGTGSRPVVDGLTELALDRARAFFDQVQVDPRRAGRRRPARLGFHQGLETARGCARRRFRRRGLDARSARARRSARDLPDAGAFRRSRAACPGRPVRRDGL